MWTLRRAEPSDAAGLVAIYAPFILDSHVSFELEVPSIEEFAQRVAATTGQFPWLVAEDADGIAGYAYATSFRARPAYQWVAESSIYLAPRARGTGLARRLYGALLRALEWQGYCRVYGGVALPNAASVAFHEALGFTPIGTFERVGYKFGRWHDVGFWVKELGSGGDPGPPPRPMATVAPSDPAWQALLEGRPEGP